VKHTKKTPPVVGESNSLVKHTKETDPVVGELKDLVKHTKETPPVVGESNSLVEHTKETDPVVGELKDLVKHTKETPPVVGESKSLVEHTKETDPVVGELKYLVKHKEPQPEKRENLSLERILFFEKIQCCLSQASSYEQFKDIVFQFLQEIESYVLPETLNSTTTKSYDLPSLLLYPKDGDRTLAPTPVTGDGNCLYRSGSVAVWGVETGHCELRIRTVMEMCSEESWYLDNKHLAEGMDCLMNENLVASYSMYMETFTPSREPDAIIESYR
jgi:hypothetical protein